MTKEYVIRSIFILPIWLIVMIPAWILSAIFILLVWAFERDNPKEIYRRWIR